MANTISPTRCVPTTVADGGETTMTAGISAFATRYGTQSVSRQGLFLSGFFKTRTLIIKSMIRFAVFPLIALECYENYSLYNAGQRTLGHAIADGLFDIVATEGTMAICGFGGLYLGVRVGAPLGFGVGATAIIGSGLGVVASLVVQDLLVEDYIKEPLFQEFGFVDATSC